VQRAIRAKYCLSDGDQIDPLTGEIQRKAGPTALSDLKAENERAAQALHKGGGDGEGTGTGEPN
jgi:hypothetical protein